MVKDQDDKWDKRVGALIEKFIPQVKAQIAEKIQMSEKMEIHLHLGDTIVNATLPSLLDPSSFVENRITPEIEERIKSETLRDLALKYPTLSILPEFEKVQLVAQATTNNTAVAFASFSTSNKNANGLIKK
jgi:hypothetical protein